jgi:putative aldouronate transport system permease protein
MASPALLFYALFSYLPMAGIVVAFQDFSIRDGFAGSDFVALQNFAFLFRTDTTWRMIRNTVVMNSTFLVLGTVVAVAVALLLFELRSRSMVKLYQSIMIFPHFLSWVVVSIMLYSFLSPRYGMINTFLTSRGGEGIAWYARPDLWTAILPVIHVWKHMGYSSILYYAALMGIDQTYFEAATIDGATRLQTVFRISIPFLTPVIVILSLLSVGRIFNADFGLFYQVPRDSALLYPTTDVIDTYVFRALRNIPNIGMPAAAGLVQSTVGLVLVTVTNSIVRRINPDYALY